MKVKILATLLTVSVLLNIGAIIFISCYLGVQSKRYRAIKRERNAMAQSLSAVRAAGIADEGLASGSIIKRSFKSLADGTEDIYALMAPKTADPRGQTLVVYLHGMGSTFLEPFLYPTANPLAPALGRKHPEVVLLSCPYRRDSSWGNDLATADISQNIREVMQEYSIKKIILMGTSMGGCVVLTYATEAPADIKDKIKGIVSVEGAGSLKELFDLTSNAQVKFAMLAAFGGTPDQVPSVYDRKSFLPNISSLPRDTRVAVISAKQDKIVPPRLQEEIVTALEQQQRPVKLISIDATHGAPPAPIYVEGLDYALGN